MCGQRSCSGVKGGHIECSKKYFIAVLPDEVWMQGKRNDNSLRGLTEALRIGFHVGFWSWMCKRTVKSRHKANDDCTSGERSKDSSHLLQG